MNLVTNITCPMEPIGLSEIENASLINRVDTKYIFRFSYLQDLLNELLPYYNVLTVADTYRSPYRTLYFDTVDLTCFREHQAGKLNRRKFRIRQYVSTNVCFLEVKEKNNKGRTIKSRIAIDEIEEHLSPESAAFIQSATGEPPHLVPQLWTNFVRITLVNRKFPERVTLDVDLQFSFRDNQVGLPGLVIAEVKQERNRRDSAVRNALRAQHIRPLRISKYCIGSAIMKPEIKSNRFKPKLRAIHKHCQEGR